MKLIIFDVCVSMQDQEQCNRMKQVCVDNGLPYWKSKTAFEFNYDFDYVFQLNNAEFWVTAFKNENFTQATEQAINKAVDIYNNLK